MEEGKAELRKFLGNLSHCVQVGDSAGADQWVDKVLEAAKAVTLAAEDHELLGHVFTRLGREGPAYSHLRRALDIYQQKGDRYGEFGALSQLGDFCMSKKPGKPKVAQGWYLEALKVAGEIENPELFAMALSSLACVSEDPVYRKKLVCGARVLWSRSDSGE